MKNRTERIEQALKETYRSRSDMELPDGFSKRVMAAIRSEAEPTPVVDFPTAQTDLWSFARFAAAAAAVALILGYTQVAPGDLFTAIWTSDSAGMSSWIAEF